MNDFGGADRPLKSTYQFSGPDFVLARFLFFFFLQPRLAADVPRGFWWLVEPATVNPSENAQVLNKMD